MIPRGRVYRYPPGRNMPDVPMQGMAGGMLSVPYDIGGVPMRDAALGQPMPIHALATALANAKPEQQRTVGPDLVYLFVLVCTVSDAMVVSLCVWGLAF